METLVDDIGSFPLPITVDKKTYDTAYCLACKALSNGEAIGNDDFIRKNFFDVTAKSFEKKISTGLDVVNTPWHYDGIRQVSDTVHKAMEKGTFVVEEKDAFLPEVRVIEEQAKELSLQYGKKIMLRVSIFGPMEQYLKEIGTTYYSDVLDGLSETIRRYAKNSVINNKYIETKVVSIDEPSWGIQNILASPDLICKALEKAFDFSGTIKQIHLHSTTGVHDLLRVKNIDVLSFEYAASPRNLEAVSKRMLENADKQIRVGISRTDIDAIWAELAEQGISKPLNQQIVESEETIKKRFRVAKEKYGELMTFTGPDCGLGSWPNQEAAELLLKHTVNAVKTA
jgi:5-methyltetrahydropteroyltriglutamate--homocysteine methyltransferase